VLDRKYRAVRKRTIIYRDAVRHRPSITNRLPTTFRRAINKPRAFSEVSTAIREALRSEVLLSFMYGGRHVIGCHTTFPSELH